jgi:hypothetical protein
MKQMKLLKITLLLLICTPCILLSQIYRTNGNVTFSEIQNWQYFTGNSWESINSLPDFSQSYIYISTNDTAWININISISKVIIDGTLFIDNTLYSNDSITILSSDGDDVIIRGGGKIIHKMDASSEMPYGNGIIQVEKGGEVQVEGRSSKLSYYASNLSNFNERVRWADSSIFIWNAQSILPSSNVIFFPNTPDDIIPILKYNGGATYIGANQKTQINGLLIIPENITMNWQNEGDKIFRNGIINNGTINQINNCGRFIIGGNQTYIGSSGNFNFNSSGFQLGKNDAECDILLMSDINFDSANVKIAPNTSLVFNEYKLTNISNLEINEGVKFQISNTVGYDACFENLSNINNAHNLNIEFVGNNNILQNHTLPDTVNSIKINMNGSVYFNKNISVNYLILEFGVVDIIENTIKIINPSHDAIQQYNFYSYINGELIRNVVDGVEYIFPVGNNEIGFNTTININSSSQLNSIRIKHIDTLVISSISDNYLDNSRYISNFGEFGFLRITPNAEYSSVNYDLQLTLDKSVIENQDLDILNTAIVKRKNPTYDWGSGSQGEIEPTETDEEFVYLKNVEILEFSDIGVVELSSEPLSVELSHFEAKQNNEIINISWTTLSEQNSDYFELQKSEDGFNFREIAKIQAKGNSISKNKYNFVDTKLQNKNIYYRLKSVDISGDYVLSKIVHCFVQQASIDIQIVDKKIIITSDVCSNSTINISIYNISGLKIHTFSTIQDKYFNIIDLPYLTKGIYFLETTINNKKIVKKIVE